MISSKCVNNCIRIVDIKAIFIDEKWFGEDERIHIPGNFELHDSELYFKSGAYIITGKELASLVDDKKFSTPEQWTAGIKNLVTKDKGLLDVMQDHVTQLYSELQADPYRIAKSRENATNLLDSVTSNYKVGMIASLAGTIPLGKIISLGDAISVIDTGNSIVQILFFNGKITVPAVEAKGCGDLADIRQILIMSNAGFINVALYPNKYVSADLVIYDN